MAKKKNKKRWSIPMLIILIVALSIAGFSLYKIISYYGHSAIEENKFEELRTPTEEAEDTYDFLIKSNKENSDTVGWLKLPGTKIDYPVMQTPDDPEYYLRKNFSKDYSLSGSLFVDARCDMEESNNILIYGHHMKSGVMFGDLEDYRDKDFYEKHKYIQFDTLEGEGLYKVIGAGPTRIQNTNSTDFKFYEYPMLTDEDRFNAYMKGVLNISDYSFLEDTEFGDKLITLITCSYFTDDKTGRYIVVAKKISDSDEITDEE